MAQVLSTEGLSKHFGGLVAVDGVDFHVAENEAVGIIGPNGAGKTTFFNLLSGLFAPTAGRIVFFGREITALPPDQRVLRGMARTFQLVSVFTSMTVWENLVLSSVRFRKEYAAGWRFLLSRADDETIRANCLEAMRLVGLESKALTMTSQLSYGFKRMLEIGIALALQPKLLLLDEPLAGLSDSEIVDVLQLLQQIKRRLTLMVIEHKLSKLVGLVDRLCVMNEGSVICEGRPDRVLADPIVRECYWGKGEVALA